MMPMTVRSGTPKIKSTGSGRMTSVMQAGISYTRRLWRFPPVIVGVRNQGAPRWGGEDPVPFVPNLPRRDALAQLCTLCSANS